MVMIIMNGSEIIGIVSRITDKLVVIDTARVVARARHKVHCMILFLNEKYAQTKKLSEIII